MTNVDADDSKNNASNDYPSANLFEAHIYATLFL